MRPCLDWWGKGVFKFYSGRINKVCPIPFYHHSPIPLLLYATDLKPTIQTPRFVTDFNTI